MSVEISNFAMTQVEFQSYGEYNYDHLVILASSDDDIAGVKAREIFQFFDNGGNVLLLGSPDQSAYFRHLLNGFGFDMHVQGSQVYDHFNHVRTSNTVFTNNYLAPWAQGVDKPILYRGIGLQMSPYESNQVYGVVRGSETAYSYNDQDQDDGMQSVGNSIIYVGAAQATNNARVVVSGSIDLLSDEFLSKRAYGNAQLSESLLGWVFGQRGILKVGRIEHHLIDSNISNPSVYKVSDRIYFSTEIMEWVNGGWVAYQQEDVVMEFVMLDPYYRVSLKPTPTKYELEFTLPDKYGVFQFKVDYRRPGYSFIHVAEKVTIRPYRHDEYERYLQQAYPYYLSTFSTIVGFLIFIIYFLSHMDDKLKQE